MFDQLSGSKAAGGVVVAGSMAHVDRHTPELPDVDGAEKPLVFEGDKHG